MPVSPTDTVTVRASVDAVAVAVTVTDVADAPSLTLDGAADSVIGRGSSSVRVMFVPVTSISVPLPARPIVSSPSQVVSCVGVSVNVPVPVFAPLAMLMSKSATAA